MTKNWTVLFDQHMLSPETVDEPIARLRSILDDAQKTTIARVREEDLIDLHFGLGVAIRNAFGLHEPNNKLLAFLQPHPSNDTSETVINKLWSRLKYDD